MSDAGNGKKLLHSERQPNRNYDMYSSESVVKLHVDGTAGVAIGPALSRIDFFSVARVDQGDTGEPIEVREQSLTVVIPTSALIEFLVNAMNTTVASKDAIIQGMNNQAESIRKALEAIQTTTP